MSEEMNNKNLSRVSDDELEIISGGIEAESLVYKGNIPKKAKNTVQKGSAPKPTGLVFNNKNDKESDMFSGDPLSKGTFC